MLLEFYTKHPRILKVMTLFAIFGFIGIFQIGFGITNSLLFCQSNSLPITEGVTSFSNIICDLLWS